MSTTLTANGQSGPSLGLTRDMVWLLGGTWQMGSNEHYPEEAPFHPFIDIADKSRGRDRRAQTGNLCRHLPEHPATPLRPARSDRAWTRSG